MVNATLPDLHEISKGDLPNHHLYLLPGTHRLIELEYTLNLSVLQTQSGARGVILGAFRRLLKELSKLHRFDLVFVDCGPSSGTLNQIICMSSDYIIPPVHADYFSTTSVFGLLTSVLDKWLTFRQDLVNAQSEDEDDANSVFRQAQFQNPVNLGSFMLPCRLRSLLLAGQPANIITFVYHSCQYLLEVGRVKLSSCLQHQTLDHNWSLKLSSIVKSSKQSLFDRYLQFTHFKTQRLGSLGYLVMFMALGIACLGLISLSAMRTAIKS